MNHIVKNLPSSDVDESYIKLLHPYQDWCFTCQDTYIYEILPLVHSSFLFLFYCIAFHFLSCIIFLLHHALLFVQLFDFSLLATSSIKLNLNL